MDFFEAQDRARRKTWKLVALYLIAVMLIIVSLYVVMVLVLGFTGYLPRHVPLTERFWHPELLLSVSVILLFVIFFGTLFRIFQLRKGGSAVAEMLGGRKVEPSTRDPKERQLMNVVEEMSIASGLPVPDVYILDNETSINAFAAGFGTSDATVGVTRGTLERLDRDELQGVIAHEFSHIFNGDMRLNIRLIGILNGILLLHLMGMIMIRTAAWSGLRSGGSGRSGGRGGGGAGAAMLAIILLGVAMLIIGYIGMLFGRMIQAAISRQREFLADAAAVQYTRNPSGSAGALRKIGQGLQGGKIEDGHAMEMSHLFFASSYYSIFDQLFATHPPLDQRIRAIDPVLGQEDARKKERIRKRMEQDRIAQTDADERRAAAQSARTAGAAGGPDAGSGGSARGIGDAFGGITDAFGGSPDAAGGFGPAHPALQPEVILAAIGSLDKTRIDYAAKLIQEIPEPLREAAHEPHGAASLVVSLLLAERGPAAAHVPGWLKEQVDPTASKNMESLLSELKKGNREWFLPLAEMALPTLRQMSDVQYRVFRERVGRLITEDDHISLFEFALEKLIVRQLDTHFSNVAEPEIRHYHLKTLGAEVSVLLSAMAHASESDTREAWNAGISRIRELLPDGISYMEPEECTIEKLDNAIDEIAASANPVKKYILTALVYCITTDNVVTVQERELMRAVSESIDCPIPLGVL